jgi:DNA-binding CsgD family transcriptional regulator
MKMIAPSIDDLILRIHAAPLEPQEWRAIIQALHDLCKAEKATLIRVGPTPGAKPRVIPINIDERALRDYVEYWGSQDLLYVGAVKRGRVVPKLVSTEQQLIDRGGYLSSAYFNEYLKPNGIHSHLNICLTTGMPQLGCGASSITLYRGIGKEAFTDEQRSSMQRLAPHLALAARTTWHIESLSMVEPLYRQTLDDIRVPVFALNVRGEIALANQAGDELVSSKRWITASRNTLVPASSLLRADDFRKALARLRLGVGSTLLLTDGATRQQAVMTTVPFATTSPLRILTGSIAGIVWIVRCSPPSSPVKGLGQLFELTAAEIRLLQYLVDGVRLRDTADQLHISVNTVRTQLKSIFRKTGQRTQGQLLALASRMAIIRT